MKQFIRDLILKAKWYTDKWYVTDEMYKALDDGDLDKARELLKEKELEFPNSDPELVGFGIAITFYDDVP